MLAFSPSVVTLYSPKDQCQASKFVQGGRALTLDSGPMDSATSFLLNLICSDDALSAQDGTKVCGRGVTKRHFSAWMGERDE